MPLTAAAVALSDGQAARAIELLEPVRPFDHAPSAEFWPLYLRGQAHLQLRNGAAAAAEFQNIVDHHGEVPASLLYPIAYLGLARAATQTGDLEKARQSYDTLLKIWSNADPDLQLLKDAQRESMQPARQAVR